MSEQISVHNAYPELPEIEYKRTAIDMPSVINYLNGLNFVAEIKRAVYVIFRNESGNGKSGVNNNYIGLQADGARLGSQYDSMIAGTCVKNENMTGKARRFVCLKEWQNSLDILIPKITGRGLYVGGLAHPYANLKVTDPTTFARAYWKEWVTGNGKSEPDKEFMDDIESMYNQAMNFFK